MIRLQLSPEEYAYLEQTRRPSRSQVAECCHYVLLNASGCSVPQIAQRLERHEHTMCKWLSASQEQGVMGLHNPPPSGRPPIQGTGLVQQMEIILAHSPSHYGYLEAGWTVDMMRDHLRQHALPVSDATVWRRLQDGGWVYKTATHDLSAGDRRRP